MLISASQYADQYASSDGAGSGTIVFVIAALIGAGLVFHRVVAPLFRFSFKLLESIADLSLKLGLYLIGFGAAAAVLVVGYAMFAL